MVRAFSTWIHGTGLSWAVRGGVPWIWPACETLHFVGMALLIGIVGLIDLRMLGLAKGLPLRPLQRLLLHIYPASLHPGSFRLWHRRAMLSA